MNKTHIFLQKLFVLGAAFLLYMVPLLVFLGGLILGQSITKNQLWAVVWGFLFMAVAYTGIRVMDRRLSRTAKLRPEIIEVVTRASLSAPADEMPMSPLKTIS